ncbi:MAG: response regulator [Ignavibacteriales bacterium]
MNILLIEDNIGDILLIEEIIKELSFNCRLDKKMNGLSAMQYLQAMSAEPEKGFPGLVILDINLPKKNGLEILAAMRVDKYLKDIPVVIYTSSNNDEDRQVAESLGVLDYVIKPVDFNDYYRAIQGILRLVETE